MYRPRMSRMRVTLAVLLKTTIESYLCFREVNLWYSVSLKKVFISIPLH